MRSKPKAAKPRGARKGGGGPKQEAEPRPSAAGSWRMSDLPLHLQVELRDAVEQAKRGEGLEDFDQAIDEGDRLSDEMLSLLSRDPRRPVE